MRSLRDYNEFVPFVIPVLGYSFDGSFEGKKTAAAPLSPSSSD